MNIHIPESISEKVFIERGGAGVRALHRVASPIVEHDPIERLDLLKEVLLDGEAQVAPAVVVPQEVAGDREDTTGLLLEAGTNERGTGESTLVRVREAFEVPGDTIKESEILGRVRRCR